MAWDLNRVTLTGNLGRDVELRVTPSGSSVATFTVASNRPIKQSDGNWGKQTEWFRVVAWDKLAESCANQIGKGKHVYIEGRLQTREWTDQQSQKRTTTEVIAEKIWSVADVTSGRTSDSAVEDDWGAPGASAPKRGVASYKDADEMDPEDIPF